MEYVNFGTAGVKVSPLALGLAFRGQADETEAQRVIEHALDLGINLIDCANMYGPLDIQANSGRSEVILGKALSGKRDDVVITSKVASTVGSGPNDRGASRFHILREVERSLTRLNTDHIDVYLLHIFDETTPLEETIRALDDLVRSGKVRYIGCSNYAAWQVCRAMSLANALNTAPFICVQNPYSLLNRQLEREMFGLVSHLGLGIMAYSPIAVGMLSGAHLPDQPPPVSSPSDSPQERLAQAMQAATDTVVATLHDLAGDLGKTPAQLALAWVLSQPEVTIAITGSDTIAHLDDNMGALGWELEAEVRGKLDAVSEPFRLGAWHDFT
jgi:1-deoxyxylulose-5-phosphate synthase